MNYSRSDQISIIKSITLRDGDSKTLDCPFCLGRKKFTISKIDGRTIWNFYKASCTIRGAYNTGRSISAIKNKMNGEVANLDRKIKPIPSVLTSVDNNECAVEYLKSVNSYDAFKMGLVSLSYDPASNRVLYFTHGGKGAVGRCLDNRKPKWMSYGDTQDGVQVGNTKHAVLVEDAASACSVVRVPGLTGYAMLGTNLTAPIKMRVRHFSCVTIILDNDASSKALRIAKALQLHTDVRVRLTKRDLKWLDIRELKELIGYEY